jgi:hypothetical protein
MSQHIVNGTSLDKIQELLTFDEIIEDEEKTWENLNKALRKTRMLCEMCEEEIEPADTIEMTNHITELFSLACCLADLPFDELYSLYIMKNCLNGFRQANGYKEGTYIKNWISADGQQCEDNVMCQEIWESLEDQNYDNLTAELQRYYDHMINTFDL